MSSPHTRKLHKLISEGLRSTSAKRRAHALRMLDGAPAQYRFVVALLGFLGELTSRARA
jgi:hypothetical protein